MPKTVELGGVAHVIAWGELGFPDDDVHRPDRHCGAERLDRLARAVSGVFGHFQALDSS
jgi:hypothetical protein